jgi:GNAT superfamily N-acetyltransferase
MTSFPVHPATADRWDDLERLFGPNGANSGCWCMWWRLKRSHWEAAHGARARTMLRELVVEGPPPGLLAYAGDLCVGWCALAPRSAYPVLDRSPNLAPVDRLPVWSITCFFIKAGWRRKGITAALIRAAIAAARESGAPALEAYPWDPHGAKSSGTVFTGLASTFRRQGFTEIARRTPQRPILRLRLGSGADCARMGRR